MKSLIYLHLNFKLNRCACQKGKSSLVNDIYLDFQDLSKREKSLSYLETLIIGGKLYLILYIYL